jgi:TatD DNase family protein
MVVTGTSLEHSQLAVELCAKYPDRLFCTAGVHPHDASDWNEQTYAELKSLSQQDCVRAIGETGLDFNRNFSPRDKQLEVFEQQIELAAETGLPLFLHQRDALDAFIQMIRENRDRITRLVAHCFTDGREALHKLLDLDCHIGITGWVCDERRGAELREAVPDIPPNRLMLETDAPYLLPRDLDPKPDDKTNRPQYLPHILQRVAELQNKPSEQLAEEAWNTTQEFFNR